MSTDITLNGVGYMVLPGSYRADSTVVTTTTPAVPGTAAALPASHRRGRAIAANLAEIGAVAGGAGGLLPTVGPVWRMPFPAGSRGLGPPPLAEPRAGSIASTSGRAGLGTRNYGFLASGTTLYRWNAGSITSRKSGMGASATGLAVRGDRDIFVGFGSGQDAARWQDATATWTASVFGAGEKASLIAMLADRPVVVKPAEPDTVYVWTSTFSSAPGYTLNGEILAMEAASEGILIATTQSWYVLEEVDGAPFQVSPVARPVHAASGVALLAHRGSALAAVDGDLWRQDGFSGRWEHIEAPGAASQLVGFGAWVLARVSNYFGTSGVWAWDGSAWFFVDDTVDQLHPGPAGLAGATINNDNDILVFDDRSPDDASEYIDHYNAATALDAGSPARDKDWTVIGAEFHRPDGENVGSWSAQLQYSVNAGRTWSNAGAAQTVDGEHQRITAELSSVSARTLMVRVNVTANSGLAPALTAIWADWQASESDGGGDGSDGSNASTDRSLQRRWRMTVLAQDGLVDRDGASLGLAATAIRGNLWSRLNLANGFTDVDGTLHPTVTLTGVEEDWPSPSSAGLHVATRLKLTLVEGDQSI